jgi:signal peptidase I
MPRAAALSMILIVIGCGGTTQSMGEVYRVPSSAMEPTLHCARPIPGCRAGVADRIVVQPYGDAAPQRADIVVLETPPLALRKCGAGGKFIKRLVGMPGEAWAERNGFVYIDGRKLDEPYVTADRRDSETLTLRDLPPRGKLHRIPSGFYVALGDNRSFSCDSRRWGLVPRRNLVGKVVEIDRGSKRIDIR